MVSHLRARFAGNQAVRAFLAEVGSLYFGTIYDHKRGEGKIAWEAALKFFKGACAYCSTPTKNLPKNTSMTVEHLFENNQFSVGLHHPGNTVPACTACNHSRHAKKGGERTEWQEHLAARCIELGHGPKVAKKRQERIEKYLLNGPHPYPRLSEGEKTFLRESCASLYQEAMMLCAPRVEQFRAIAKIKVRKQPKSPR